MNIHRSLKPLAYTAQLVVLSLPLFADPIRIIATGDAIPSSPGLTAGLTFRHPRIDNGRVAFFTDHVEFGLDKPSNSLVYWDGTTLTKIADDFTPVPGLGGAQELEFNDLTDRHTLSIDTTFEPTVVFWASYLTTAGNQYAIYQWRPGNNIETIIQPGPGISWILPGQMTDGSLVFRTEQGQGPVDNRGLYQLLPGPSLQKLFSPGDDIQGVENATYVFVQPDFIFNGNRIVMNVNTSPTTNGGWRQFQLVEPIWLGSQMLEGANFTYWTNSIRDISSSASTSQGEVGLGQGMRNGSPSSAVLYKADAGIPWEAIVVSGSAVDDSPTYSFFRFGDLTVQDQSVVFSFTANNAAFEEISGIYFWKGAANRTLIDNQELLDGKQVNFFTLHDRDPHTGEILFSAEFTDNTAALYTLATQTSLSYDEWTTTEFPNAAGDPAIVGLFEDPEGDGVVNILEFILGGQGSVQDAQASAVKTIAPAPGQAAEFEYRRRVSLPAGISAATQLSATLTQWDSGAGFLEEISIASDPNDANFEIVRLRPVGAAPDAAYVRIMATHTP